MKLDNGAYIGQDFGSALIKFNGQEYSIGYTILDVGRFHAGDMLEGGSASTIATGSIGFGGFGRPTERYSLGNLPNHPTAADTRLEIQAMEVPVIIEQISPLLYKYTATFDISGLDPDMITEMGLKMNNGFLFIKTVVYPTIVPINSSLGSNLIVEWSLSFDE